MVVEALTHPAVDTVPRDPAPGEIDPFGSDLQLALTVCYELHYRGFAGVDPEWEWHPDLLRLRSGMERTLLSALHPHMRDTPLLMLYPGRYDGQSLRTTVIGQDGASRDELESRLRAKGYQLVKDGERLVLSEGRSR